MKSSLAVEAGVLVEGDGVHGMRGAEDVAAATAVMTALEEGKRSKADGVRAGW